jgi:hypothetical protein
MRWGRGVADRPKLASGNHFSLKQANSQGPSRGTTQENFSNITGILHQIRLPSHHIMGYFDQKGWKAA